MRSLLSRLMGSMLLAISAISPAVAKPPLILAAASMQEAMTAATLPIAIYSALQLPDGDAAVTRLAIISVALSLCALFASEWMVRRSGAMRGSHVL